MNGIKQYKIRPSRLVGSVHVSGAKNSALKLLTASLLTDEKVEIDNYPAGLVDVQIHVDMLRQLGKDCHLEEDKIIITEPDKIKTRLDWHGPSIRNTLLILGALVTRTGEGAVPLPGGCQIGDRKYDLHEMLLREMGAEVWTEDNMLCAEVKGGLKGIDIHLPVRSTGATENAILSGCLANGTTRVWNPHVRPEIMDLISYLTKMGAKIEAYGQEHIEIEGVERLSGIRHTVIGDNMEAITWLIGSVITNGDVEIVGFPFRHLEIPLIQLRESGAKFYRGDERLIVRGGRCYPIDISTGPYPGINSDMQPFFALYGVCARGESRIIDLRFPGRYAYTDEIKKMGGRFKIDANILRIFGGTPLHGSQVTATDLRAGAALALGGLVADRETVIEDAWQISRGYNRFFEKIRDLGANIDRE
ncbi:MAG: UDP-N-acetylglucosamine 1-carboxyvinyltransferase [Desulfobacterales bacterium]|nr:UDP-N-acetylglucosamine 1-carboxyvinyltransferase [Desulfobacterales bacterium]